MPPKSIGHSMSVVHTIQSIQRGQYGMADSQGRHACQVCGRKFTGDRISTHENVCMRRKQNNRLNSGYTAEPSQSVDPSGKRKSQMMTLNDLGRPKSKQVNKMPSLRNKPAPVKKVKEVKAFAGSGVRLGAFTEETKQESKPSTSFSGLQKVNAAQPKVEYKWRCLKCLTLNKVTENQTCSKCGSNPILSTEEEKQKVDEDEELDKMMSEFGNMEEIEEQREDILDLISELELEATPIFICYSLEKLVMILGNIIKNPQEDKYKVLKMDNNVFYSNIGRYTTGIKLIKLLGFTTIRLENNKLAYKYTVSTAKGLHPVMHLAYDELRTTLAKHKGERLGKEDQILEQIGEEEQERIQCHFCGRKFARDRIDKHQPICSRIVEKPKRKQYNDKRKRLQGTVFEKYKPMYKNSFHDRFKICLRRRDVANMDKILQGLNMSIEEYQKHAHELKQDNDLYFQCLQCREIMNQKLTNTHKCDDGDEEEENKDSDKVEQMKT